MQNNTSRRLLGAALMGAAMLGAPAMGATARRIDPTAATHAVVKGTTGTGGRKPTRSHRQRWGGNAYPFSSDRQHARHAARQYTTIVSGFLLMQTLSQRCAEYEQAMRGGALYVDGKQVGSVSAFNMDIGGNHVVR